MNSKRVDTRVYKRTGQYRLRFWLTDEAVDLVKTAMLITFYENDGAAVDAICMSFHAGNPAFAPLGIPARGSNRFLVKLWPDQYENVRAALDFAGEYLESDEDALVVIATTFMLAESTGKMLRQQTKKSTEADILT